MSSISPDPISISAEVLPPAIMRRTYYSSHHLWAAEHFAKLATDIENASDRKPGFDIRHRAYVTGAVLSAVAFLEAAINELFKDVVDAQESYISSIENDSRKIISALWQETEGRNRSSFSILDKYQTVLKYCGKSQFKKGTLPYQDAELAIKLRNELVHYKPESYGGVVQHKFLKQLQGKFSENLLMANISSIYFPDRCLGSSCATWAVHSVKNFADKFFQMLNISPNYQLVSF